MMEHLCEMTWLDDAKIFVGVGAALIAVAALCIANEWRKDEWRRAHADIASRIIVSGIDCLSQLKSGNRLEIQADEPRVVEFRVCEGLARAFFPESAAAFSSIWQLQRAAKTIRECHGVPRQEAIQKIDAAEQELVRLVGKHAALPDDSSGHRGLRYRFSSFVFRKHVDRVAERVSS